MWEVSVPNTVPKDQNKGDLSKRSPLFFLSATLSYVRRTKYTYSRAASSPIIVCTFAAVCKSSYPQSGI